MSDTEFGGSLYAARQKIYPREIGGRFVRLRVLSVILLLGLYYLLPWLQWNGHQAVLFDLPARKFHIFSLTFWPQDFFYLAWLLIIAALALFFFTALAGRLWCGYACPQTVWTEVFIWMERLAEGKRSRRMKLDRGPWTAEKWLRKLAKHAMWLVFALYTGFTFVGYFTPIRELAVSMVHFDLGPWETFWTLFYGFATWGNAGFMREQVCKYMCPYARFQSAMFDRNTLIISYDPGRGEPRGRRSRSVDPKQAGLGDCIDCTLCVQVCPTGIDIRNGLQYECIACAACIDACDAVMDEMRYPRGLIRYSTEEAMEGGRSGVLRPRILLYGAALTALCVAFGVSIAGRASMELEVIRDRNALYRTVDEGIENVYLLKILNMDERSHSFDIALRGLPGAELDTGSVPLTVPPGTILPLPARVRAPLEALRPGAQELEFVLTRDDGASEAETARFLAPGRS